MSDPYDYDWLDNHGSNTIKPIFGILASYTENHRENVLLILEYLWRNYPKEWTMGVREINERPLSETEKYLRGLLDTAPELQPFQKPKIIWDDHDTCTSCGERKQSVEYYEEWQTYLCYNCYRLGMKEKQEAS